MVFAKLVRGPLDNQYLPLPTPEPWPRIVVPEFNAIAITYLYLLAGGEDDLYFYLYDEVLS